MKKYAIEFNDSTDRWELWANPSEDAWEWVAADAEPVASMWEWYAEDEEEAEFIFDFFGYLVDAEAESEVIEAAYLEACKEEAAYHDAVNAAWAMR